MSLRAKPSPKNPATNSDVSPTRRSIALRVSRFGAFGRGREQQRERLQAGTRLAAVVERFLAREQRQQIDDVVGGVIVGRHALLRHGGGDGVLEEFLQAGDSVYSVRRCAQTVSRNLGVALPHMDGRACRLLRV